MENTTNKSQNSVPGDDIKAAKVAALKQRIWDNRFDICFIKAWGNFICIFWKIAGSETIDLGICDMEMMRCEKMFFFGHRSFIINLSYVLYYCRHHNGLEIGMTEKESAFVAPDFKDEFLRKRKKFKNIVDYDTYVLRKKWANWRF